MFTNEESYTRPTRFIEADHEEIRRVAAEATAGAETAPEKAVRLFYFVRDRIKYNPLAPMLAEEDYRASVILQRGIGFCVQKAVLLAAMARAAGIASRLHFADLRNRLVPAQLRELMGTELFVYHGYVELYLGERWVKATPAFDREMCDKHGFRPVEFDGRHDAVFHPTALNGAEHIAYVRDRGCAADLPYRQIIEAFWETYGKDNPAVRLMFAESAAALDRLIEKEPLS